jgi:hypothetical protein
MNPTIKFCGHKWPQPTRRISNSIQKKILKRLFFIYFCGHKGPQGMHIHWCGYSFLDIISDLFPSLTNPLSTQIPKTLCLVGMGTRGGGDNLRGFGGRIRAWGEVRRREVEALRVEVYMCVI